MSDEPPADDRPARSPRSDPSGAPTRPVVTSGRELVAVATLLVVPVAVVPAPGEEFAVVSLWGLLTAGSNVGPVGLDLYPVWSYFLDQPRPFGTLPASIRLWPVATAFHVLATVSAASGVAFGREDRRVTGGLLVLAALATLTVAVGLAGRLAGGLAVDGATGGLPVVLPLTTIASLAVVAVAYRRDLTRVIG